MRFTFREFARLVFGWEPEEHLSETAWLNGVRGLAAFLVMMSHYSMAWLSAFAEAPFGALVLENTALTNAWYWRKGQRLWAPWRLPILKVFMCNGGGQVAIFFVLSGFVLTWGPLGLAQSGNYEKLYQSLGSSTFRRWARLYLPCAIVTFIFIIYEKAIKRYEGFIPLLGYIWEYLGWFQIWANPFRTVAETVLSHMQGVNLVVWTIPHEFSGSIFVYVLVLTLGRYQNFRRRFTIILLITLYAIFSLKWDLWLFGTGMALADYSRHTGLLTNPRPISTLKTVLWSLCLMLGLVFLSYAGWAENYTRPGFDLLGYIPLPMGFRKHAGEDRFWWGVGATLIITSSCHLRLVRKFFELPLLQHLGKISFMLYLIHLLIGNVIGQPIQDMAYANLCTYVDDEDFGIQVCRISRVLNVAILVGLWVITVPPLFIVTHILERTVDRPVTEFAKTIDEKILHGFSSRTEAPRLTEPEQEHLLESAMLSELEMSDLSDSRSSREQEMEEVR